MRPRLWLLGLVPLLLGAGQQIDPQHLAWDSSGGPDIIAGYEVVQGWDGAEIGSTVTGLSVPLAARTGTAYAARVRALPINPGAEPSNWATLAATWPDAIPQITSLSQLGRTTAPLPGGTPIMAGHVQSGGTAANNTTSVSRAFAGNVTANNLVVIIASRYSGSNDAWLVGDCTKSAGTATIETIALDRSINFATETNVYAVVGIWSAIVTGSGSLTLQCAGAPSGSYLLLSTAEFSGNWDANRAEAGNTNGSTSTATSLTSNSATSAGAAVFVGGSQINSSSAITITLGGSGWSSIYSNGSSSDDNGAMAYKIVASGTTDAYQLTISGASRYSQIVQAYKEAAGAAASIVPILMRQYASQWK
jgi:hypothetical protein